jgi:hypothetical protein
MIHGKKTNGIVLGDFPHLVDQITSLAATSRTIHHKALCILLYSGLAENDIVSAF